MAAPRQARASAFPGLPVSRVAHAVGYATPSAFLAAFRRTVGTSPGRYLNGDASPEAPGPDA